MLNAVKPFVEVYRVTSFISLRRAMGCLRQAWQGITLGWSAASRYRRLSLMSNEELANRGLDRASISRHAFFGEGPIDRD